MKLISCIIRPERLGAVKEALFQAGVTGISISRVSGHGGEQELVEHYRGSSVVLEFREKVECSGQEVTDCRNAWGSLPPLQPLPDLEKAIKERVEAWRAAARTQAPAAQKPPERQAPISPRPARQAAKGQKSQ